MRRNIQPTVVGPVPTLDDLPLNDPLGTVRRVQSEGKDYMCVCLSLVIEDQWREWDGEDFLS